jgi:hypothetical protein
MVTRARVTCGHLGKNGKSLPSLHLGNADKEREGTGSSKGTQRASHLRAAETESERAIVNWRLGSRFTSLSIAIVIRSQRGR